MNEHGGRGPWRLLLDGAADGAWNMAVDEAILDGYAGSDPPPPPTLRLYAWAPPALSLGARQSPAHDATYLRAHRIDLVRRPTGGQAVLHEHERTYAVIGSLRREPFPGGVLDTYGRIASALLRALRALGLSADAVRGPGARAGEGPLACFERPSTHEITVEERKIVGSAQVRRRGAFLQHGSILLRADADRLSRALAFPVDGGRFTGLETAMGRAVSGGEIDRALGDAFAEEFETTLVEGGLTAGETTRATQLRSWKYDSAAWTLDGRIGRRERAWGPAGL